MNRRQVLTGAAALLGSTAAGATLALKLNHPSDPSPTAPKSFQPEVYPVSTPATQAPTENTGLFNPPRGDVRLLVLSDMNSAYGSVDYDPEVDRAISLIPHWQPDIVIGGGDMVAGQDPRLSEDRIRAMWAAFDAHVAAPLRKAKMPYGFTIGNHDASSARAVNGKFLFRKERDLALAYWQDPTHDPGLKFVDRGEFPFYYTFEQGGVFYLVWDASSNHIPPEQLAWAEKSLGSAQAQNAKLRIVIGHLPLYAVAVGRNDLGEVLENAEERRALLEKYRVHTYISGHHHAYYPAHKGQLQLLHTGILGAGPRPLIDSKLPTFKTLTVLDVNLTAGDTTYTTFNIQTLKLIDQGELPRYIAGINGIVMRRDVEWSALTPAEKAACQNKIGSALCKA